MIQERDEIMLEWLSQFKMATPMQINQLFYNNLDACYRRLRKLHQDGIIKRERNVIDKGWIYCNQLSRSTKQVKHCLIRNDFYIKLIDSCEIVDCIVGRKYDDVIPDGVFVCRKDGKIIRILLEVETQRNSHAINIDKYNSFFLEDYSKHFKTKPLVVYVTNKKMPGKCSFDYVVLEPKLSNFNDIWR